MKENNVCFHIDILKAHITIIMYMIPKKITVIKDLENGKKGKLWYKQLYL